MPLRFVLDEQLRGGALWNAVQQHNARGIDLLDVERVGDPTDLPSGTSDSDILAWAEREHRILLSLDKTTLPGYLASRLQAGNHSPGVLLIRPASATLQVLAFLVLAAHAGDPVDYENRVEYIP